METHSCDVLIIGSGPGGAMSAALLAEAGLDVLIVEEGPDLPLSSAPSYSLAEMNQKYRNSGLTTTFGAPNITYIEGRCVGGSSEINAGLYHRPLESTLRAWQLQFQVDDLEPGSLDPHFDAVEAEVGVSGSPLAMDPSSEKIQRGAQKLGWKAREIQRFWRYEKDQAGAWVGHRQSMSQTLIPRARRAGARLLADTRILKLVHTGSVATEALGTRTGADGAKTRVKISFDQVFVCAGAIHSPLLLRRSGIVRNVGDNLRLHPMIRFAARFREPFNDPHFGVPVHQIEEFKPLITLGGSHSSLPHLAMWMGNLPDKLHRLRDWQTMAVFYVAVVSPAKGTVRDLPWVHQPFARYGLGGVDRALLGEALYRLGQLAFAAGAVEIYNPIAGGPMIRHPEDLAWVRAGLPLDRVSISTIHLFSTCPMGEDRNQCAVDSHGRLHGFLNVHVNDASILPLSPAVNPQGTILALARRNALHLLQTRA